MRAMAGLKIDELTELVSLEQWYQRPDGEGGLVSEWRPMETLWAHIVAQKPGTITERWQGERPHFAARYWVWLRAEHVLPKVYRLQWGKSILTPLSAVTHIPGQEWQVVLMEQERMP